MAPGAPILAPSAYAPDRSRAITSTPGCAFSQSARTSASRPSTISTGRRDSKSRKIVPYFWRRRNAKSSTPRTRGADTAGNGELRNRRSKVSGLTHSPSLFAIRAPASPPAACAISRRCSFASNVRRAYRGRLGPQSSAKVARLQAELTQRKRRTVNIKRTVRPRQGRSNGRRT